MGYFADGMEVPDEGGCCSARTVITSLPWYDRTEADLQVTALLAEDNWGNLVAVLPWGSNHSSGGGIYYHADCTLHYKDLDRIR